MLKTLTHALLICLSTYTRLPVPRATWTAENQRYALCFLPLAGLFPGLLAGACIHVASHLHAGGLLTGAAACLTVALSTGGIHMDGLMDTADALASWQPREKRLAILRDSHVGAFAVLTCAIALLLAAGLFADLTDRSVLGIAACFVLSRAAGVLSLTLVPQARPGSMLDGFVQAQARPALIASASGSLLAAEAILLGREGAACALWCLVAVGAALFHQVRRMKKDFGGTTGDLTGALITVCELAALSGLWIGGRL